MFIPHTFFVGDYVRINADMSNAEGTVGAGHDGRAMTERCEEFGDTPELRDHLAGLIAAGKKRATTSLSM
jgi:hypothetical protein